MEVIERRGARLFGSGNIKALYEAKESGRNAWRAEADNPARKGPEPPARLPLSGRPGP